jgi:hypothetical protein
MISSSTRWLQAAWGVFLAATSITLLLWPGIELARALFDDDLDGPRPAAASWRWHRALTPAFEQWAVERRASDAAASLSIANISGTEWPLFGTVFYLRATENLDREWRERPQGERPAIYARAAVDAAADLLADPVQATWVQQHWGEDYLRRENVFYRMLVIDGLASQARLLGDTPHRELLRSQVEGLATELDASSNGLLADYPGQTFPADVAAAWHAILRADAVLGSDHRAVAERGLRGLVDALAPELGLPPFAWYGEREPAPTEVRGSANAWLLHNAAFVWPEQAQRWVGANDAEFRHRSGWLAGYREFALSHREATWSDVDSGPVIAGLGTSATAFGVGMARSTGDRLMARAMGLEMIAASWPLPNGRLLAPRLLSDLSDAPLVGEAAIVYNLSQMAAPGFEATEPASSWSDVPGVVWLVLIAQLSIGGFGAWRGVRGVVRVLK